ncbi:hypothetical protein D1007_23220 [Hordeum vulgare]|nr:hypothetical protein D1007_23220 [Hordeum vulgare]
MVSVKNVVYGEAILEGNLPLLQVKAADPELERGEGKKFDNIIQNNYLGVGEYVEDLMRPFIPARDGTLAKPKTGAQVLVGRVLTDLQEVASLVQEASAEQVYRMCTLENKMDECLRCTRINGKLTEDLIKELKVVDAAIQRMHHDEPIDTRGDQLVYIERVANIAKLERDGRIEECYEDALAGILEQHKAPTT